jgi:hypothetical protein
MLLCSEQNWIGFPGGRKSRCLALVWKLTSLIHACDTGACDTGRRSSLRPRAPSDCDDFLQPWPLKPGRSVQESNVPGLASLRRLRISRRTANGYTRLLCNYLWHEMEISKRCYAQGSYVDYFVRTPSRHSVIHSAHTFSQKGLQSDQLDQRTILVQNQSRQFGCGSFRPA